MLSSRRLDQSRNLLYPVERVYMRSRRADVGGSVHRKRFGVDGWVHGKPCAAGITAYRCRRSLKFRSVDNRDHDASARHRTALHNVLTVPPETNKDNHPAVALTHPHHQHRRPTPTCSS
jgi:hypothetical protein